MDTTIRYLRLLTLLPREPFRVEAKTLCERLAEQGFAVDVRTVQRDLLRLSRSFPIVYTEGTKPYGWAWARHAPPFGSAGLDTATALALVLAGSWLTGALPPALRGALDPIVRAARRALDARSGRGRNAFAHRLRVLPYGPPIVAPAVDAAVLETVVRAVGGRRRLAVRYAPRGRIVQPLSLDPLGLVWHGGAMSLVARADGVAAPVHLQLHRLRSAEMLDAPAGDDDFDLDAHLASARGVAGEPVRLVLRLRGDLARAFEDAPLSADQSLSAAGDDDVRLAATVVDSADLRAWLLGFADALVVESPAPMAEAIATAARATAARYAASRPLATPIA